MHDIANSNTCISLQILGLKPQEEARKQTTSSFAESFMEYMKAPSDNKDIRDAYTKHTAILVCKVLFNSLYMKFIKSIRIEVSPQSVSCSLML